MKTHFSKGQLRYKALLITIVILIALIGVQFLPKILRYAISAIGLAIAVFFLYLTVKAILEKIYE